VLLAIAEPSLPAYVLAFLSLTGGGYGVGTFLGKTAAFLGERDKAYWGDIGGIVGGTLGLGFFMGFVIVTLLAR
jgi:hypothetical protein